MTNRNRCAPSRVFGVFALGLLLAAAARAQYRDDDPRQYRGEEIRQTVGRISYLAGPVSFARGDEPDNWQSPDVNVPLTLGDRLYTGRGGRAELQIHGGTLVRLDGETDLAALNLTDDTKQLSLTSGAAAFEIRRLGPDEVFEVDSPNAAVTFEQAGDYRIDVDRDGNTRVGVRRGRAIVAAGGGQVALSAGDEMDIDGIDQPRYDLVALGRPDRFDNWVAGRRPRVEQSRSRAYVSEEIAGVADLDEYGRWEDIPEYGHVWSPASVDADWAPYRVGHWVWQDPWGWTWVSGEPWGWAPYHYGRWVTRSSRWFWVPDGPRAASVHYSPALVAFVGAGGGPGFSAARTGGSFVGWFPLAPRDPFVPWWGPRTAARAGNAAYVNRASVTVVNRDAFVSGGLVARNVVTDRAVLRDVVSAPVVRGPLPVMPTSQSLRVAARPEAVGPRPPASLLERAVVARVAPPPPPPAFAAKVSVIRDNGGAPVGANAAARLAEKRPPAATASVRPVAAEPGRMTLAPSRPTAGINGSAQPVPVAPPRGRVLATEERPFAPSPGAGSAGNAGSRREAAPPERAPDREGATQRRAEPVERQAAPAPAAPAPVRERPANEDWRNRAPRPVPPDRGPETAAPAPTRPPQQNAPREREVARERTTDTAPAPPRQNAPREREIQREGTPDTAPAGPGRGRGREVAPSPTPQSQNPPSPPAARDVQRERRVEPEPQAPRERPAPPQREKPAPERERPVAPQPAAPPAAGNRDRAPEAPRVEQKPPSKEEKKPPRERTKDEKDPKKEEKKPE